jgi:hypothetical protein
MRLLIAAALVGPVGVTRNLQGAISPQSAEHAINAALELADILIEAHRKPVSAP